MAIPTKANFTRGSATAAEFTPNWRAADTKAIGWTGNKTDTGSRAGRVGAATAGGTGTVSGTDSEVDPCEGISDEDIRITIHNARGPRSAVFSPEVPFEALIRKQIARLLDPSLQCARFIYNELVKMSHHSMISELHRFPVLKRQIDEVAGQFLRENLEPAESTVAHFVEMEMDYINTSHPNFIGGM